MSYQSTSPQVETTPLAYSYVRYSTDKQENGDSERRQVELSERYCEKHNLILCSSEEKRDRGLSAFHGTHIKNGYLGSFLKDVNTGIIPKGSYLLIEDFDRLSRQELLDAQDIVRQILKEDITIVTLLNEVVYTRERVNRDPGLIYTMTAAIILAHEESRKKQERLKAAWVNKRNISADKILTAMCPSWLTVDKAANEFFVCPIRAALLNRIFNLYNDGLGQYNIAKILNSENIKPPRSQYWSSSSIAGLMSNIAVVGDYQPHVRDGRQKRLPVGDVLKGYYPQIVSEVKFQKAQDIRQSRNNRKIGRKNKNYNNLFAGMARCGYCGGTLTIDTNNYRAKRVKTYQYLYCHNNAHGHLCTSKRIRYNPFEQAFMHHITEVNFQQVFNDKDDSVVERLEFDLYEKKREHREAENEINNLFATMGKGGIGEAAHNILMSNLNAHAEKKLLLERVIRQLKSDINARKLLDLAPDELNKSLVEFYAKLSGLSDDELYIARAKLAQVISTVVDKVYVYMDGFPKGSFKKGDRIIYRVQFQNGAHRVVSFDYDSPEQYIIELTKVTLPV